MSTKVKKEKSEVKELELIPEKYNDVAIYKEKDGVEKILSLIEDKYGKVVADISTSAGRQSLISTAAKISRCKVYLDDMGKKYVSDLKATVKEVDSRRKRIRDRCDELRDQVRQPVTDYENREKERIAKHEEKIKKIQDLEVDGFPERNSAALQKDIDTLKETVVDSTWEEFETLGKEERLRVIGLLEVKLERVLQQEADAKELEELRKAKADMEAKKRELEIIEEEREKAEKLRLALEERAEKEKEKIRQEAEAEKQELLKELEESKKLAKASAEGVVSHVDRPAAKLQREEVVAVNQDIEGDLIEDISGLGIRITKKDLRALVEALLGGKIRHVSVEKVKEPENEVSECPF